MSWTSVSKPNDTTYTSVAKPTGATYTNVSRPGGTTTIEVGMTIGLLMPLTVSRDIVIDPEWTDVTKPTS